MVGKCENASNRLEEKWRHLLASEHGPFAANRSYVRFLTMISIFMETTIISFNMHQYSESGLKLKLLASSRSNTFSA